MFSTVSSGMGATVCTAGRLLLVAPLTKPEDEEAEEEEATASVAPEGKSERTGQHKHDVSRARCVCVFNDI